MQEISYRSLEARLRNNVCEIFFLRRHRKNAPYIFRRMLCTNSGTFLSSFKGRLIFKYRPPRGLPPFNPKEKNIIITWDIISMDYRCIPVEDVYIVNTYPITTKKGEEEFWKIFDSYYYNMSSVQKQQFNDSYPS